MTDFRAPQRRRDCTGRMQPISFQRLYDRLPIRMQQLVISAAGWRSYRARFGEHFDRTLRELERTDLLHADAVRNDQERRLREIVRWASNTVPYYRDLFRKEGIDPRSIRTIEDLDQIPFLEKETVQQRQRDLVSEQFSLRRLIPARTSGTTGTALRLYRTREALAEEYAVAWRQRRWFGVEPGDRFAAFGGQTVVPLAQDHPPYWRYDAARSRMLFSLYHMSEDTFDAYARELSTPGYVFWQGYPSSIGLLSEYFLENGVDLGEGAPRVIFTSSETLLDFHRDQAVRATGAPISDRYGNSEISVSVAQCPDGEYHVDTEFGVVEIDPYEESDQWVRGEVISTGFANPAMPLIRYRTGDIATLQKHKTCSCGRARPILERIDGRIEDYIITPEGRRIGRMDHIFKDTLLIREAQIIQRTQSRIDVRIVPRPGFGRTAQRALERELRKRLGDTMEIRYELIDTIPRGPNGKFRVVISEIDAGKLAPREMIERFHADDPTRENERTSKRTHFASPPRRSQQAAESLPEDHRFRIEHMSSGRVLYVQRDGTLYASRRCSIYRSRDDGVTWQPSHQLPRSKRDFAIEQSRLACRLLRREIRCLVVLKDGTVVAVTRSGVFHGPPDSHSMERGEVRGGSTPVAYPMRISAGPDDRIVWGEYFGNPDRREVRLFASTDHGRTFEIARTFPARQIRHIHNVVYDEQEELFWVMAGDLDEEPGIGCLSRDLRHFDWLVKGDQAYRTVAIFDDGDSLIYGTDTELETNYIVRLDKRSGRADRLQPLEGSCLHACRFGDVLALTSTVEPSAVNHSRWSQLWLSHDGVDWTMALQARKDVWSAKYFQYGSLLLPTGASERDTVALSGQGLTGYDESMLVGVWNREEPRKRRPTVFG